MVWCACAPTFDVTFIFLFYKQYEKETFVIICCRLVRNGCDGSECTYSRSLCEQRYTNQHCYCSQQMGARQ